MVEDILKSSKNHIRSLFKSIEFRSLSLRIASFFFGVLRSIEGDANLLNGFTESRTSGCGRCCMKISSVYFSLGAQGNLRQFEKLSS